MKEICRGFAELWHERKVFWGKICKAQKTEKFEAIGSYGSEI